LGPDPGPEFYRVTFVKKFVKEQFFRKKMYFSTPLNGLMFEG